MFANDFILTTNFNNKAIPDHAKSPKRLTKAINSKSANAGFLLATQARYLSNYATI